MTREWILEDRDGIPHASLRVTHGDGRIEQSAFFPATETNVRGYMARTANDIAQTLEQRDAAFAAANQQLDLMREEEANLRALLDQVATSPAGS